MMHHKICQSEITLYNLQFGPGNYFKSGSYCVFGKFQGFRFLCHGISGSQSLWLPLKLRIGLKIFHPKGFSGTLQKMWSYFKVQKMLATVYLAPNLYSLFKLEVHFVKSNAVVATNPLKIEFVECVNVLNSPWLCYGIMMDRVLLGSMNQVLGNLERFGVEIDDFVRQTVVYYLSKRSDDALNLIEYQRLANFFGANGEAYLQKILGELKEKLPKNIDEGIDMFSLSNIVLDENGKGKVIDCDLARIKVC